LVQVELERKMLEVEQVPILFLRQLHQLVEQVAVGIMPVSHH
jgi:hypothetical protein